MDSTINNTQSWELEISSDAGIEANAEYPEYARTLALVHSVIVPQNINT